MNTACTSSACRRVSVRTRAEPAAIAANAAPEKLGNAHGVARRIFARATYLAFLIVVPGSVIVLALWHGRQWLAHRRGALASTH
jgi:hypothetical protein